MSRWAEWASRLDQSLGRPEAPRAEPAAGRASETASGPPVSVPLPGGGSAAFLAAPGVLIEEAGPAPARTAAAVALPLPLSLPPGARIESVEVGGRLAEMLDSTSLQDRPAILWAGRFSPPPALGAGDTLVLTANLTLGDGAEWTPEDLARRDFGQPVEGDKLPVAVQTPEGLRVPVFVDGPHGRRLVGSALIRGVKEGQAVICPAYLPAPGGVRGDAAGPVPDGKARLLDRVAEAFIVPLARNAFGPVPPVVSMAAVEPWRPVPALAAAWRPAWLERLRRPGLPLERAGPLAMKKRPAADWAARLAATPFTDLADAWRCLGWRGEPGAVAFMNRATFSVMRACLGLPGLDDANPALATAGLPPVAVEDGLMEAEGGLRPRIPDAAVVLVLPGEGRPCGILWACRERASDGE